MTGVNSNCTHFSNFRHRKKKIINICFHFVFVWNSPEKKRQQFDERSKSGSSLEFPLSFFFSKKTNTILKIITFQKKNVSISSVTAQVSNDFMNSTKYINLIVTTGYFLSKCSR